MQDNETDFDQRLKLLSFLVIALAVMTLLSIAISLVALNRTGIEEGRFYETSQNSEFSDPKDPYAGFHRWPIEKQISESTLVLMYSYKSDGENVRAVIEEILKKDPNIEFNQKVGETLSSWVGPHEKKLGDGVIVFFVGPELSQRQSVFYHDNRVPAFSGFPLSTVCELIRKTVSEQYVGDTE